MASRASFKDYYKTLGVKRTANEQELKQAYRRLARKYHPDVNPGDKAAEEQFKEVQEAYDVLRDKDKRRKYDQFGAAWRQGGATWQQAWDQARRNARGAGPQPGGAPGWDTSDSDFDFGDLLGNLFGERFRAGGRWASRPRAGEDIEQGVEISLEEAFHGGSRMFQIQVPNDSGGRSTERIEVRIPPGVPDGQRLRVAGKGHPGIGGGARGDLHLKVRVRPHPQFERDGDDLATDVPVPVWQAGARRGHRSPHAHWQRELSYSAGDPERAADPPGRPGDGPLSPARARRSVYPADGPDTEPPHGTREGAFRRAAAAAAG